MVKKLRKMAEEKSASMSGLLDSDLAATIKDSAQQIWLAGLGAFAKAQEEGKNVFEALVKEGVTLQKKTRGAAEEKMSEASAKMSAMANDVSAKASHQWDKLETIFEQRVSKALGKLGVPASREIDALSQRIDELSAKVAALSKRAAVAKKAPAKRPPRKTAL